MDKTVLIEQTSKRLKRWELIVTAMLFLTLFAGFGLLYVAIPLGIAFFGLSSLCFLCFIAVRIAIWWWHGYHKNKKIKCFSENLFLFIN